MSHVHTLTTLSLTFASSATTADAYTWKRETRDEYIDISDGRNTGPTKNLSAISDKSSGKSGEMGDAYRRLLAGARDGSNSVTGMKPPKASTWVKEAAAGTTPKNIREANTSI